MAITTAAPSRQPRRGGRSVHVTPRPAPLLLALLLLLAGCQTVAVTGRQQLTLMPANQLQATSYQQYDAFLKEHKVVTEGSQAALVKRVGERIRQAVEDYFQQKGMASRLAGYQWEFNLVAEEALNAWCLPGGKVVVYQGLLPVARDETGLAVVMGHEIAHAVANHGAERMSQQMLAKAGGELLARSVADKSATTQQLMMVAYGLGAQVGVLLPYSRLHESEADELGLIFMAMAGYDPREAVGFWERMIAAKGDKKQPPALLSTHPTDNKRIRDIQSRLPRALTYYHPGEEL